MAASRKEPLPATVEADIEGLDPTMEVQVSERDIYNMRREQMLDAPIDTEDRLVSVDGRGEWTVFTFTRTTLTPYIPDFEPGGPMPGYESRSAMLQFIARFNGRDTWVDGRGPVPDFITNAAER